MPHVEVIDLERISAAVPYKVTAWYGKGKPPAALTTIERQQPGVHVAQGWAIGNLKVVWRGLAAWELRKGQFAVWRVNESPDVFEGGVIDTYVSDSLNALLAFSKDFDLDQNTIETNALVYQQVGLAPLDAPVVQQVTRTRKGTRRASANAG